MKTIKNINRTLRRNPGAIRFLKDPTKTQIIRAIKSADNHMRENMKYAAIAISNSDLILDENDVDILSYFSYSELKIIQDKITEKAKLKLIKEKDYCRTMIECFDNPSEELQLAAINNLARNIKFIKNPTEKVKNKVIIWDKERLKNDLCKTIYVFKDEENDRYLFDIDNDSWLILNNLTKEEFKNMIEKLRNEDLKNIYLQLIEKY